MIVEIAIEAINKIISFSKHNSDEKEEYFKEHISSLFEIMLKIQKNYRETFSSLYSSMNNDKYTKNEFLTLINGKRNELADLRILAYTTAKVLKDNQSNLGLKKHFKNKKLLDLYNLYTNSIIDYFSLNYLHNKEYNSITTSLIKNLEGILKEMNDEDKINTEIIKPMIKDIINHIDETWSLICDYYAKIKFHSF